ncbi:DegT/DnrJ/EryC1/StrS family aminotransferase (plasmid) [Legionella sp. D16C41]|uniref:DegT/DnrJ/EryC1/StrS family aminotransferase n=1 Tax=Legionella sp. D16C41 TaxID=3402688 RepID=UPI003AF4EA5F
MKRNKPIRNQPLPWELPGAHYIDEEEINATLEVLYSKSLFRFYGENLLNKVDNLEKEFKKLTHREHALAVNSGTAALYIALSAFKIGPGDEVLVPGYLWVSCISAIVRTGAIPRLVDIDESFCMSESDLLQKINIRSKVILYIHMSGAMGNIQPIMDIAKKNNLYVLEDCAQAVGATLDNKPAGFFGDIAIYSFQLNKNMTSGEGGMLVCDDKNLYDRCFAIHDLGYARNANGRLDTTNPQIQLWGIGARMSELTGAVALIQLAKLQKIVSAMHHSKYRILENIKHLPGYTFRTVFDASGDSGAFLIISFPSEEICRFYVRRLKEEGIDGPPGSVACVVLGDVDFYWYYNTPGLVNKTSNTADGFPWSHPDNQFAKDISYQHGALPSCDDLAARSLKLAIASNLTEQDENDIVAAFEKIAKEIT